MSYKLTQGWPRHIGSGAFVNPESNTDYLAWLEAGNTPEPADPILAATALEQIRALEAQHADAQARMTRQSLLAIALDKACADPAAQSLTRDQVHTLLMSGDNGYAALWNLEQQVAALRALA